MDALYPFIDVGLKNHEEYEVCNVTVGVVGDVCRALDAKVARWCDPIVQQLLADLQSTQLHRSVKPPILSCFGDIALAIGPLFEKYLAYVAPMLQSATQLSMSQPKDDEEMIDYNNALRNGIFEAYAGMLQGFKEDKSKIALLMQHAEFVLAFVEEVHKDADRDEAVTRAMVGVMGDMADTMDASASSTRGSRSGANSCRSARTPTRTSSCGRPRSGRTARSRRGSGRACEACATITRRVIARHGGAIASFNPSLDIDGGARD